MTQITNAFSTHGTVLQYKKSGAEAYKEVAQLITVTPPSVVADEIDATNHGSNGWKEYISGLKDGGSMPFKINVYDTVAVKELFDLAESGEVVEWRIIVPTEPELTIDLKGFLKSFTIDEMPASPTVVTASAEIRNSGQPVYTFGQ